MVPFFADEDTAGQVVVAEIGADLKSNLVKVHCSGNADQDADEDDVTVRERARLRRDAVANKKNIYMNLLYIARWCSKEKANRDGSLACVQK